MVRPDAFIFSAIGGGALAMIMIPVVCPHAEESVAFGAELICASSSRFGYHPWRAVIGVIHTRRVDGDHYRE